MIREDGLVSEDEAELLSLGVSDFFDTSCDIPADELYSCLGGKEARVGKKGKSASEALEGLCFDLSRKSLSYAFGVAGGFDEGRKKEVLEAWEGYCKNYK